MAGFNRWIVVGFSRTPSLPQPAMNEAAGYNLETTRSFAEPVNASGSGGKEVSLHDVLKHCSTATYEAACHYRKTGDTRLLSAIVGGVIERYVERDVRARLGPMRDDLRLIEDLGLDSLTMMEIVSQMEDALRITISDAALRHFRTLGDVRRYVECRAADAAPAVASDSTLPAKINETPTVGEN